MLEKYITNECKPSSRFLLLLCLRLRPFYLIIVLLMDLNQWTSWGKLQYLWHQVYCQKNDFFFPHPGVIHHGSQFSMGSFNIWLRARKFFREVSNSEINLYRKEKFTGEKSPSPIYIWLYYYVQSSVLKGLCYTKGDIICNLHNIQQAVHSRSGNSLSC